jgi:hypothetical protein
MNRVLERARSSSPALPQPQHVGSPLQTGETALMRTAGSFFDVKVQVRGVDGDLAVVLIRDTLRVVELSWLRRA